MRVVIIANGNITDYAKIKRLICEDDYVICADGGTKHAYNLKCTPNLIMGDFDSMEEEWYSYYQEHKVPFEHFPVEKDQTDTEIALLKAIEVGAQEILMLGCTGTRLDHTLANIHLLKQALIKGVKAKIVDEYNEIYLINKEIRIGGNKKDIISLLPFSDNVKGICATNVYYPVSNMSMVLGDPIGVSNTMEADEVKIQIDQGLLLVIKAADR